MSQLDRCPVCGGEVVQNKVEKLLIGGRHTAAVIVDADVCTRCGERIYTPTDVRRFEDIRSKLKAGKMDEGFRAIGQAFEVVK